ncbi:hypothetical protein DUI87_15163 [Hirundo rustica rustica]|uniref:Uncharacterized protein n=1 Tax=Hirundo rustica rustica TaxID=333673 RepID=A0A3M0K4F7_HIRRU|nr:hypothetical protein DUI87_15163 [Hirundo rustica rustica]
MWDDLESHKSINISSMGYTMGNGEAGQQFLKCSSNDVTYRMETSTRVLRMKVRATFIKYGLNEAKIWTSSCDQAGTALAGFVYGSAIRYSTELRLRGAFSILSQEKSTHYLRHGWKSQVLDDKLERHFFTQRHLAMHVPPKRDWWTWPEAV